jgi:hypothetical protein
MRSCEALLAVSSGDRAKYKFKDECQVLIVLNMGRCCMDSECLVQIAQLMKPCDRLDVDVLRQEVEYGLMPWLLDVGVGRFQALNLDRIVSILNISTYRHPSPHLLPRILAASI